MYSVPTLSAVQGIMDPIFPDEGECKVKQYGKQGRHIWRKLSLAIDANRHDIVCAGLSLNNTDTLLGMSTVFCSRRLLIANFFIS